jgi:hypothetical protein
MIVLCGVDEFPSGPWTKDLAAHFAARIGADLVVVDGGSIRDHAAVIADAVDGVMLFGHVPPSRVAATLRASPCPVVIAPGGVSARDWREVVLASHGDAAAQDAAVTAGFLAARLGAPLRVVVASEVPEGPRVDAVLHAAGGREPSLVVVAADPRPRWFDILRPSFTAELLHGSRDLVVVVPPAAGAVPSATVPDAPGAVRA